MRLVRAVLLVLAATVGPVFAAAPVWDNSGNSQLSGSYYFRQVFYVTDVNASLSREFAFYGIISFSGNGTYSVTDGTLVDSTNGIAPFTPTGTYTVSASGYGSLSSPLVTGDFVYFLVSNHILVGSETESGYNDLFIAAPYSNSFTNASFQGTYNMSAFFPGSTPDSAADATYQLNPDGAGHLGTVSITGFYGAGGTGSIGQSNTNVPYAFSNNAVFITFPTSTTANFYSGKEYLYLSPDKNFVFGGSPNGYDMFVGVRGVVNGTPTPLNGLYYEAGLDVNTSPTLDTYYGVFNAYQGSVIGHERLLVTGQNTEGYTYYTQYPSGISASYKDPGGTTQYTIGADGIRIAFGIGPNLGIGVALPFSPPAPAGGVYIDPTGVVSTASSAPFTAGIAPGEFLTFYNGVNLAGSTAIASVTPFPTTLGGVRVLIDGIPAPLYYVSPTSLAVIVPYAVSTYPIATIQVINNGVASNTVTVFVNHTAPGVFTVPAGGSGYGAIEHADGSLVTVANPAKPGETVAAFVTGLGTVFPPNPDGAIGPYTLPLSTTTNDIFVNIGNVPAATPLPYAGLAPYLAGLYQVNFTIPATAVAGDNVLGIGGPDSFSTESLIPVGSSSTAAVRAPAPNAAAPAAAVRYRLPRLTSPPTAR